jgi:hypothetical protein
MKTMFTYIAMALIIASCSKDDTSGPYTISGTLLNNCEKQEPVANTELYFLVDWEAPEEERIASTDANGNFKYAFDGPPNNESVIGGTIRLTNEKVVLAGIPNSSFNKNMDAGTIYVNPPQEAEITFRIQGNGYTDKDSVVISISFHSDLRIISNFRVAGPFDDGVVFTKDWKKYASSGVQTMPDPFKTQHPYTRRLNGTYGTSCRWQIVEEGGLLGDVQYESLLMEVCENEGTLTLELPDKS